MTDLNERRIIMERKYILNFTKLKTLSNYCSDRTHFLGLSFAGLNYASAEEQPTSVNEATVEAIIKEGAIDVEAPAPMKPQLNLTENTPATAWAKLPQCQKH